MEEKNQQEKMAVARQVELFENAFNKAKENGGIWLENDGRKAPRLYLKPLQISAFNAIILGMHSDQNGYKTNQYTLFSEAKKRRPTNIHFFQKQKNAVSPSRPKKRECLSFGIIGMSM